MVEDWNTIEAPDPIDPGDTLADPEKLVRAWPGVNEAERQERQADNTLTDFGSAAVHRRWRRDDE